MTQNISKALEMIRTEKGRQVFSDAFDNDNEAPEVVMFARGYAALEKNGYSQDDDGFWVKETPIDKFQRIFSKKEQDSIEKNKNDDGKKGETFSFKANIIKTHEEQRLVYGWASVVKENGESVTDSHGDTIEPEELVKAAHGFVSDYRKAKAMHKGGAVGEIIDSIVFTDDVQKSLGIDLEKIGWFIGMKVHDDDAWAAFKSGELSAFSIGGFGERIEE